MLRLLRTKVGVLHQAKTSNLYELLERILNKGMFIRGGKYSRQADPPEAGALGRHLIIIDSKAEGCELLSQRRSVYAK